MPESVEYINVEFFNGARLQLSWHGKPVSESGKRALSNFLSLGKDDRLAVSRHVFAYYLDQKEHFEKIGFRPESMPRVDTAESVWDYVQPRILIVRHDHYTAGKEHYVVVEAECDWHAERGLMLCFRDGQRLTKCGGYNGHVTNRNGFADDCLIGVVYKAMNPNFTTHNDT